MMRQCSRPALLASRGLFHPRNASARHSVSRMRTYIWAAPAASPTGGPSLWSHNTRRHFSDENSLCETNNQAEDNAFEDWGEDEASLVRRFSSRSTPGSEEYTSVDCPDSKPRHQRRVQHGRREDRGGSRRVKKRRTFAI